MPHCPVIGIAWWLKSWCEWAKKTNCELLAKGSRCTFETKFKISSKDIVNCQDMSRFIEIQNIVFAYYLPRKSFYNLSLHQTKCTLFHQAAMTTSVVDRSYPVTLNLHLSFNISPSHSWSFSYHFRISTSKVSKFEHVWTKSLDILCTFEKLSSVHSTHTKLPCCHIQVLTPPKGEKHLIMWGFSKKQHRYLGEMWCKH